jgi:hypothetical protein
MLAILASAIVVLGGLAALTRAIWKVASDIRDNEQATTRNTKAIVDLTNQMDGRLTRIEDRIAALETGRARRRFG